MPKIKNKSIADAAIVRGLTVNGHTIVSSEDEAGWQRVAFENYGQERINYLARQDLLSESDWRSKYAKLALAIFPADKAEVEKLFLKPPARDDLTHDLSAILSGDTNFLNVEGVQVNPARSLDVLHAILEVVKTNHTLIGIKVGREFLLSCIEKEERLTRFVDAFQENPAFVKRFSQLLMSVIGKASREKTKLKPSVQLCLIFAVIVFKKMVEKEELDESLDNVVTYTLGVIGHYLHQHQYNIVVRNIDTNQDDYFESTQTIDKLIHKTITVIQQPSTLNPFKKTSIHHIEIDSLGYFRGLLRAGYAADFVKRFLRYEYDFILSNLLRVFDTKDVNEEGAKRLLEKGSEMLELAIEDCLLGFDEAGPVITSCLQLADQRGAVEPVLYMTGAIAYDPNAYKKGFSPSEFHLTCDDSAIWTKENIIRVSKLTKGELVRCLTGGSNVHIIIKDRKILETIAEVVASQNYYYGAAVLLDRASQFPCQESHCLTTANTPWMQQLYNQVAEYDTSCGRLAIDDLYYVPMKVLLACRAWRSNDRDGLDVLRGITTVRDVSQFYELVVPHRNVELFEAICMHDKLLPLIESSKLIGLTKTIGEADHHITKPKAVLRIIAHYVEHRDSMSVKSMQEIIKQLLSIQTTAGLHLSEIDSASFEVLKTAMKSWAEKQRRSALITMFFGSYQPDAQPAILEIALLLKDSQLQKQVQIAIALQKSKIVHVSGDNDPVGINASAIVVDYMDNDSGSEPSETGFLEEEVPCNVYGQSAKF